MNLYPKALQYITQGYSIIPLKLDKKPAINSWREFQKAQPTDEMLERWWDCEELKNNIGVVTGKISGITVIDIDTKDPENTVALDTFPQTYTVQTPSGGYHLYYEYDARIKQTANTYPQFPHVDIRNDGGYVVAPPSETMYRSGDKKKGGRYKVVCKMHPAPFPADLFLTSTTATSSKKKGKANINDKIEDLKKMKNGDGRNTAMCSIAGSLLYRNRWEDFPNLKVVFNAINDMLDEPLKDTEIDTIWKSITAKVRANNNGIELEKNEKGIPYPNLENIKRILTNDDDFVDCVFYDEFSQTYKYRPTPKAPYRDIHDTDITTITRNLSKKYDFLQMVVPQKIQLAVDEYGRENSRDLAADYIKGLTWDKVDRLSTWLTETYGTENDEYHRAVASNWMKGLVSRITNPGCKFDYVLVLEGPQGAKKSTSLGVLGEVMPGGNWHVETTAAPDNKDFLMLLQGNAIIEFSEGETLSRGAIKQLKAVITTQYDKYRSPYGRYIENHPRRCVFAMTTNQSEYLKDETGNRRWLPVACMKEAEIEWLTTNREQLLAEAYYRVNELKETTYEFPEEATMQQQMARQIHDPNADRVAEWYLTVLKDHHRKAGITPHMAFTSALGQMNGNFTRRDEMSITTIFKLNMGLVRQRVMIGGHRAWRWYKEGEGEPLEGVPITQETLKQLEDDF